MMTNDDLVDWADLAALAAWCRERETADVAGMLLDLDIAERHFGEHEAYGHLARIALGIRYASQPRAGAWRVRYGVHQRMVRFTAAEPAWLSGSERSTWLVNPPDGVEPDDDAIPNPLAPPGASIADARRAADEYLRGLGVELMGVKP